MKKTIVFDMDGTLANFYGVKTWLADLAQENTRPYEVAEPLYDMTELNAIIAKLHEKGYIIVITTWLAKNGTQEFNDRTRAAKKEWLKRYGFVYDKIHLVKYGTTKADCTRKIGGVQYLFDDNEQVRKGWDNHKNRFSFDANQNIITVLKHLLLDEFYFIK